MNPISVLAIAGTADTTATLAATQEAMQRLNGSNILVSLQGVTHGFDFASADDIFTWTVVFLNATTTRDPVSLARLQRMTNVAGGGDDRIELTNMIPFPLVVVEQNVVQSLAVAHRAYVLENGRIALSGKASELAKNPELRKSYLGR